MKTVGVLLFMICTLFAGLAHAEIYRWTDDRGVVHITDDYAKVPVKDRSRVITESDTPDINVMPAGVLPESEMAEPEDEETGEENWIPPKQGAPETIWIIRPFFRPAIDKHKHKAPPLVIPKTPARKTQDKIEEQLRKERRSLDNNQLPARRAQDQIEEQIRKTRDGISGH